MGRKKTYDPEEVRRKAMGLFWEKGFHNTSANDLSEQLGINKYSLYAEFDSKHDLLESTLALSRRSNL